ncbi:replicative DNA helicase [Ostreibacterium oceani]|uniref:Replicative DNA helicase n=1 Tax=Ostreibacterium oceani TaxID=2654998 RepID=A0A6N7EYN1_9GAMM|nr:replicative DNA helicase [Ostreibacterium oceani]MPV85588.1 replicative DNA helicase [Ostreibacterium oceani]
MNESVFSNAAEKRLSQLKVPPHSDEAEAAVIGALLIDNNAWDKVSEEVSSNDFYRQAYRMIFRAIEDLVAKFQPFDPVTVIDALRANEDLAAIGGEGYILEIVERTLSSANVGVYAKLVREKSILRQLIDASSDIAELGYFPGKRETKHVLDLAEKKVFDIAEQYESNKRTGFLPVNQVAAKTIKRIQALSKMDSVITGVPTGWKDLDETTSGLNKGDLVIVAARPSMGKTAFCLNIATNVALEKRQNVAFFSLEMPGEQLTMRLMAALGQINQTHLRTGKLQDQEWNKLRNAVHLLSDAPIFIDDNPGLTPTELRAKCRRLVRENGELGLVIVDYLQLMEVRDSNESRVTQVSEISRSLKMLAKEFDCPVMALSQLNRSLEQRPNKRPVMSDLRESGAIEQDADIIAFIYRDAVYAGENEQDRARDRTAEIIIGKQRNGPIGTVKLTFMGEYTQFVDYAPMTNDVPFE